MKTNWWKWILAGLFILGIVWLAAVIWRSTATPKIQDNPEPAGAAGQQIQGGAQPTVNLALNNGQTYVYNVGSDGSIWMSGDNGLELLKLHGGAVTLTIPAGWNAKVFASAGTITGPNGTCHLGNPATCGGSETLQPGVYTFHTGPGNDSAGIKADVWSN